MKRIIVIIVIVTSCLSIYGQEVSDTLQPSYSTASRSIMSRAGEYNISSEAIDKIISPAGSADAIKFLQTMPGVSMGAEGASAIYVRGGNLGGNVITLDDVPIYASSHLLGYSSIYNGDLVSETVVRIGGFLSSESNISSSHIALKTVDPDTLRQVFLKVDNFSLGATLFSPIKGERFSFSGGLRYYPVGLEYGLIRGLLSEEVKKVDNASAGAYDVFGKLTYRPVATGIFRLSFFLSQDRYRYDYKSSALHKMGWSNFILNLSFDKDLSPKKKFKARFSVNKFCNYQGEKTIISENRNNLVISNGIGELTFSAMVSKSFCREGRFDYGVKSQMAVLSPGSSAEFSRSVTSNTAKADNHYYAILNTFHGQLFFNKIDKYDFLLAGRINSSSTKQEHGRISKWKTFLNPGISLMAKRNFGKGFGVEFTSDYLTSYYHNLEGVPLGWSLDMIIPSGYIAGPEKVRQIYAGLFGQIGAIKYKIGAYDKSLNNVIYFKDATKLFGSVLAGWEDNIKKGDGRSSGVEFLAEKSSGKLKFTLAYTYSKTKRRFEEINGFNWFPAKFDRPNVLNVSLNYSILDKKCGIVSYFTYQSGHMETVPGGEYQGHMLGEEGEEFNTRPIYWYASINNFRFPAYIRADLGVWYTIDRVDIKHHFTIGVYNMTNRHNPFSVVYDPTTYRWKKISILSLMPSVSYKLVF